MIEKESLSFSQSLSMAIDKITCFSGRSRRSEFWWPMLLVGIIYFIVPIIALGFQILMIPLIFRRLHDTGRSGWWWGVGAIVKVIYLAFIIYNIVEIVGEPYGVDDYDISLLWTQWGALLFFAFIIIIYNIVLLVFLCQDSQQFDNEYGESPKYILEEESQD